MSRRVMIGSSVATMLGGARLAVATTHRGTIRHRLAAPVTLRHPQPPRPLVILDPGHGGKDPGAIGYAGTYEKHIAIAAATELHARLLRGRRVDALLTRDDDRFIPLPDRVGIAEARGAALFVSMHADAIASPAVRGASVYTLSEVASDGQTAALARRENSADRFALPRFHTNSPAVERILASLTRQETRAGSSRMAQRVVGSLGPGIGLLANPSRHAAFVVLQAPDIPSVLVEMGFMSNPKDEALLRTAAHRARITLALEAAINGFFADGARLAMASG